MFIPSSPINPQDLIPYSPFLSPYVLLQSSREKLPIIYHLLLENVFEIRRKVKFTSSIVFQVYAVKQIIPR